MKNWKHGLLLAVTLPVMIILHAQTADEIINKHFEAIGGKDKISQIKSIYTESTVQIQGTDAPSSLPCNSTLFPLPE